MAHSPVTDHLPLTETALEILLALARGAKHGYSILQDVEERGSMRSPLHPGTLYRALSRMLDDGFIEERTPRRTASEDARRRYYRITGLGRNVAAADVRRLEKQIEAARRVGLVKSPGVGHRAVSP